MRRHSRAPIPAPLVTLANDRAYPGLRKRAARPIQAAVSRNLTFQKDRATKAAIEGGGWGGGQGEGIGITVRSSPIDDGRSRSRLLQGSANSSSKVCSKTRPILIRGCARLFRPPPRYGRGTVPSIVPPLSRLRDARTRLRGSSESKSAGPPLSRAHGISNRVPLVSVFIRIGTIPRHPPFPSRPRTSAHRHLLQQPLTLFHPSFSTHRPLLGRVLLRAPWV